VPSTGQIAAFAVASVILVVIPGPGVLFMVGRALAYGRRTALATAYGHAPGNYAVAACMAFGIGTLAERSAQAFLAVKLFGAAYLTWLGIQAIRHRKELASALAPAVSAGGDRQAAWKGFVVGVTNPKGYILFGTILPQFVDRPAGHIPLQMLLLALVPIMIGLVTDTAWVLSASTLRAWFARSPRRLSIVGGAGGLAMIGMAVNVAVTQRTD
jgi:threonine/homoserine/homoserine lactone efflux protein